MKILTMNDLIKGQKYWVLCFQNGTSEQRSYNRVYSKLDVSNANIDNTFKLCTYITEFKRNNISYTCCFEPINEKDNWFEIDSFMISVFVFKEYDDCLVSLYKIGLSFTDERNIKLKFTSTIAEKIKESQENNPHKWIF